MTNPKLIITSDWHLREDQPICRTDGFWKAQWKKVDFISNTQKEHDCPVIHAGDLFHHWKPSPYLLSETIKRLPDKLYTIYGNHDLPQHNTELAYKCGIRTLEAAGKLNVLSGVHWNDFPSENAAYLIPGIETTKEILVWHVTTWKGNPLFPGDTSPDCYRILKKYPQFNLIITGHVHQSFTAKVDGRLLINPGNITRQTADEGNKIPKIYLWYGGTDYEEVELPYSKNVITREHIDQKRKRDDRIDAFVSKLDNEWEGSVSFEENLERFFANNRIRQQVKEIVLSSIDNL